MKYKVSCTAAGNDIEVQTDHTENCVPWRSADGIRRTFLRREKRGIVYCFGNCHWNAVGMTELFRWLRNIDSTVTVQDVMKLCPFTLTVVDELRFYAEMDALGFSHTE